MARVVIFFGLLLAAFIACSASPSNPAVTIRPTHRPTPLILPVWLYKGDDVIKAPTTSDHPILPSVIDDVKMDLNRRYVRSLNDAVSAFGEDSVEAIENHDLEENIRFKRSFDSPSFKHHGGGHSRPSGSSNPDSSHPGYNRRNSRDTHSFSELDENVDIQLLDDENEMLNRMTRSVDSSSAKRYGGNSRSSGGRNRGATHPGYNRRNARDIRLPFDTFDPLSPPRLPSPFDPRPVTRHPIPMYLRAKREAQDSLFKKPTHRDVIIPNWNPNARVKPWQKIGVKTRN